MGSMQIIRLYNVLKKLEQVLTTQLADFNLTPRLWFVLNLIQNGASTIQTLQAQLQTNKSTLSRQLNQLHQAKLIEPTSNTKGHQKHYQLTSLGLQAQNSAQDALRTLDTHIFKYWSIEEQQLFRLLLDRFKTNLDHTKF